MRFYVGHYQYFKKKKTWRLFNYYYFRKLTPSAVRTVQQLRAKFGLKKKSKRQTGVLQYSCLIYKASYPVLKVRMFGFKTKRPIWSTAGYRVRQGRVPSLRYNYIQSLAMQRFIKLAKRRPVRRMFE